VVKTYPSFPGASVVITPEPLKNGTDPLALSTPPERSAPVPPFATGRIPDTSEVRLTAEEVMAPCALLCNTPAPTGKIILEAAKVRGWLEYVLMVPLAEMEMPLFAPAEMEATGVPDALFKKANFALAVEVPPKSTSSEIIPG
jgi:hypothetical protein